MVVAADMPAEKDADRFFEHAVEGIYRTTPAGGYLLANPALAEMYGYGSPAELMAGLSDISRQLYVDPRRRAEFRRILERDGVVRDFESEVYRRDSSTIWISENGRCIRDASGQVLCYEGMVQDITRRRHAEEAVRLYAQVFEATAEAIAITGPGLEIRAVNAAFRRMIGWSPNEEVSGRLRLVATEMHPPGFREGILAALRAGRSWQGEIIAGRRDGTLFPASVTVSPMASGGYIVVGRDLTEAKATEERLRQNAERDPVTLLANRRLLVERLKKAVRGTEGGDRQVAVLAVGLNKFKYVNETFGHGAGDDVLRMVARRLLGSLRLCDTVARIGGAEFIIVLPDVGGTRAVAAVTRKIQYALADPLTIAGRAFYASATIGYACCPLHGERAEDLIANAHMAMHHAKKEGRGLVPFQASMAASARDRLGIDADLRLALGREELQIVYQPKVDMTTGRVVGAEALLRWTSPTRGPVSPGWFIPLAEESGLILQIGEWMLPRVCRQVAAWQRAGLNIPSVSVNLSPIQFLDPDLLAKIATALATSGLPARCLELEITETAVAGNVGRAIAVLDQIRELGIGLSVDDFGTGYSSLAYLQTFPIQTLKIDHGFCRGIDGDPKKRAIVASIVALAANMGFGVVAEGVETPAEARVVAACGCTVAQGFLFGRPMSAPAFEDYLELTSAATAPPDELTLTA